MKKRILGLALAIMLISTAGLSAFGVGLQFNGNAGTTFDPGVSLTFKLDQVPLVFAASWNIGESVQTIGLTGDYWLFNKPITNVGSVGKLNWFLGLGFFANMIFANDFNMAAGIRIPFGLNMFIADGVFEPYIQVAPSFGIKVIPSLGADKLFWPVSAGFRIWFK